MKKNILPFIKSKNGWRVNSEFLFYFYSTHGLPPEISLEKLKENISAEYKEKIKAIEKTQKSFNEKISQKM